ncbi:MAG: hypothetical protein ACYS6K_27835 [Planctomycetota bacterium]
MSQSGLADSSDRFWTMSLESGGVMAFSGWYQTGAGPRWFLVIRDGYSTVIEFSSSAPATGGWYCVEMRWVNDAVNGLGELWVDGVLVCSITGRDTSAYGGATLLRVGLPYLGRCGATSAYVDCVSVSDSYVGPE